MRWIFVVLLVACAGRPKVVDSLYDTELAVAFAGAREAVAAKRAIFEEDAATGTFQTDWEAVEGRRIRFFVAIIAPRPLRVDVVGVIEGESGTSPEWLRIQVDLVRAAIHERLRPYVI